MPLVTQKDTIIALSTPPGQSAIALIRLSGKSALSIVNHFFKTKDLFLCASHTVHFGTLLDDHQAVLDEVVVTLFRAPTSFTKEDVVEISCHGAYFIIHRILQIMIRQGARMAQPGEFTQRAFFNGQLDLTQAEAVADLIAARSATAHKTAMHHLKGGLSKSVRLLKDKIMHFAALLELSLDFAEEDVPVAAKEDLKKLVQDILDTIQPMLESFTLGNAIKHGIPMAIVGQPNAGKSTLLNTLLQEERALVSSIPGTTRDFIEGTLMIEGVHFQLIDTAGLHHTEDMVESMGIQKTYEIIKKSHLILYIFDISSTTAQQIEKKLSQIKSFNIPTLVIANKIDRVTPAVVQDFCHAFRCVPIAAQLGKNIQQLKKTILEQIQLAKISSIDTIITNERHYESLLRSKEAMEKVLQGIQNELSNELLVLDIRTVLEHLGTLVGEVTTEDVLGHIFAKFCIGK